MSQYELRLENNDDFLNLHVTTNGFHLGRFEEAAEWGVLLAEIAGVLSEQLADDSDQQPREFFDLLLEAFNKRDPLLKVEFCTTTARVPEPTPVGVACPPET